MISRKVLNKATWILAAILAVVLIGLTLYQNHLIKKASRESDLQVTATEAAGGAGSGAATVADEDALSPAGLKQQRIELQKRLVEDPAIRESIRTSIESQYAALFEALALSEEVRDKLESLMENSAMNYLILNPDILTAVTPDEKAAVQQRYDYLKKETNLKAEALLGAEAYGDFIAYEERATSRSVVDGFATSLTAEPLTDRQARELIEILYAESQKVCTEIGYDPTNQVVFPSDMDTAGISKRMEVTERAFASSLERAEVVLAPAQFQDYQAYLRDYIESQEMSLIMMHQQFGE